MNNEVKVSLLRCYESQAAAIYSAPAPRYCGEYSKSRKITSQHNNENNKKAGGASVNFYGLTN